jgi:hypothetical protein
MVILNLLVSNISQSHGNPVSPLDVLLEYLPSMPEKIIEEVIMYFLLG